MDHDFRNITGPPYEAQVPMYPATTHFIIIIIYPFHVWTQRSPFRSTPHTSSFHHTSSPSTSSGLDIRVALKPEYRITPLPQLSPQVGDIPRSNSQFDFEFERKILAEADKEVINRRKLGLENVPPKPTESNSS